MAERPCNVLFLCTGNSARSILAEAILNREGMGKFHAYSAGSHPNGAPHPCTIDLLKRLNHDVSQFRFNRLDEFGAGPMPRSWTAFSPSATKRRPRSALTGRASQPLPIGAR